MNPETGMIETQDGSFTVETLDRLFKLVQNPRHWKDPIRARIPVFSLPGTRAAVEFYTATQVRVMERHGDGTVTIEADGYRKGPAGDH